MSNIYFYMCVNDYDGNGQHTGRLHAAEFSYRSDLELHLDCVWLNINRETYCKRVGSDRIRVGRRVFKIEGYRCYVGNMMWDAALVSVDTAQAIAEYLRSTGKYEPTSGTTEVFDMWESGGALDFKALVDGIEEQSA